MREQILPRPENREVMKMLKLLQLAYKEISRQSHQAPATDQMLEGEQNADDETRTEILFDKYECMCQFLCMARWILFA